MILPAHSRPGRDVIADAVFARQADREAIERAAAAAGVPFVGLWLDAPEDVLLARAACRRRDPSDADAGVIRSQLIQETGPILWHRVDASRAAENVLQYAIGVLNDRLKPLSPS